MAGKERRVTLEGLASKVRNIDGHVPNTILKNPAMVTKVGSINMPVKQSLEPTGTVEPEQRIENESYLDKLKSEMPVDNNGGRTINFRNHRNRIDVIRDSNGVMHEGGNVPIAFVNHYEAFLGVEGVTSADPSHDLFTHQLDTDCAMDMVRFVTKEEIKGADAQRACPVFELVWYSATLLVFQLAVNIYSPG
ncbi:hypothetical protein QVD17_30538 [Tagetes erecta]|uniref:Uncharacterized protein n=1 Tax=Tagetes erecta TaxID=13708 RepID=A0AAD8K2U2_TARER|nr:hypothetical protein QVD17_30538 [Tagetes erecta]